MVEKSDRAKLIDEAGEIEERVAPFSADLKRLEALRKEFRNWADADKIDPESTVPYLGSKYMVTLDRCGNQRRIRSMAAVFKALGKTKFMQACSMTLKSLEAALGAGAAQFLINESTGSRDIHITRLPKAAK